MFPHPGPVNSPRREFPASDVCELRTNWEYQLLFRISSRGPPSSKCLCAEPPRFFYPRPVLAKPGVNQIAITIEKLSFFCSIAKYGQSRNYFTTVSISRTANSRLPTIGP